MGTEENKPYKIGAGIDQSLNSTGVVVMSLDSGEVLFHHAIILNSGRKSDPKLFGADRLIFIRDCIKNILAKYNVEYLVIEGYSFGSRGSSIFDLGEIGGAVRVLAHDLKIPVEVVPPKTLKKYITGNGNASKEEMSEAVLKKYSKSFKTSDETDAFSLILLAKEVGPGKVKDFCASLKMTKKGKKP